MKDQMRLHKKIYFRKTEESIPFRRLYISVIILKLILKEPVECELGSLQGRLQGLELVNRVPAAPIKGRELPEEL
jgi:hypothetical protein